LQIGAAPGNSQFVIFIFQFAIMGLRQQAVEAAVPTECRNGAITIGNFDGVHLGHQALLAETVRQAQRLQGPAVAVTFEPHPQRLLHPETFQPVLTALADRAELLERYGITHVLALEIAPTFLQLTAREFFERIIHRGFQARAVIEGMNFGFGRGREGDKRLLEQLGRETEIDVALVPAVAFEGKPISTSRIRNALLAGDAKPAAAMLGRPYAISGTVVPGQRRGQSLGFPTANLVDITTLIPGDGVYAVRIKEAGTCWSGAANVGPNPTFDEMARKVEVHLIDFHGDLYGQRLTIEFIEKIRSVRRFADAADLIEQLKQDIAACRLAAGY
jgi:riboflavin kinase/FMN adenylyltransferase